MFESLIEIVVFIIMLPIVFKSLEILDFEKIFRKTFTSRKQLFYIIMTVCIDYIFTSAVMNIVINMQNLLK